MPASASIGIATYDDHTKDVESLLRNADVAMYLSKTRGKGRFEFFETEMHEEAIERLDLKADLQRALEENQFLLHYQPIFDLKTGRVRLVEALIRWKHPERGMIPPERFITLAEENGLIVPIGEWVIREASRQAAQWHKIPGCEDISVSVNLSMRQLQDDQLINALTNAIAASGITPEVVEPRKFSVPIDPGSVHQGAALEVKPLNWGGLEDNCIGAEIPRVLLLDRVTDPHNVGAILRSAEVLGASAVIGTRHHSAPETGALAKTASGALERQPYLRMRNLSDSIVALQQMGYLVLGLDGEAEETIEDAVAGRTSDPIALVLGAEGPGLRQKTKETVDKLVKIDAAGGFGSLNVSNAAALSLYASLKG